MDNKNENLDGRVKVLESQIQERFDSLNQNLENIKSLISESQSIRRQRVDELRKKIDGLDDRYADKWVQDSYKKLIAGFLATLITFIISLVTILIQVN